jgi:hypothetical protein
MRHSSLTFAAALGMVGTVAGVLRDHGRLATMPAHPMSIISVSYAGVNWSTSSTLSLFRGVAADFVVNGDLVDLSTGVEVRTSAGQTATGISVSITGHSTGSSSACSNCAHLNIHLTSTSAAASGGYTVLIHYLAEVNGPDAFNIRMFDHGSVSTVAITAPAPLAAGGFLVGDNLTLQVQGSGLSNAALLADSSHGMHVLQTVSASASAATFLVRFDSSGVVTLPLSGLLCDKNLFQSECGLLPGSDYAGTGQATFVLRVLPKVTSVSPQVASVGSPVAIAGTRLSPKGYSAFVDFVRKYRVGSSQVLSVFATAASGGLQFAASTIPVLADAPTLRYLPVAGSRDSLAVSTVALPSVRVVGYAPNIMVLDSVGGAGARRPMLKLGTATVAGENLVPDQATVTTTTTTTTSTTGVIGGISSPSITTSISLLPTLVFRSQGLAVQSVGYRATSTRLPGVVGADTVVFTVAAGSAFSDTATGGLTITTPGGSQTTQNVVFVPPPSVSDVRTFNTQGIEVSVPLSGGTLVRGKQYRLHGKGLVVLTGAVTSPEVMRATISGAAATVALAPSPNVDPVITIPQSATTGPLVVTGPGGTSTVGTFTVTDPPPTVTIVGLNLSPTPVTGGQPITATVAINGIVPPGGSAGNIAFESTSSTTPLILPTGLIPVTANPLIVTIPTRAVSTQQFPGLRVSNDPSAAQISSAGGSDIVNPPTPTSVVFAQPSVAGGSTTRGVVHLNTTAPLSAGITVALTNSDPTTATVPATATMNGDTAVFNVSAASIPTDRTITVTATIGGVSQSATLTVHGAALSAVTVSPTSVIPGVSSATVTATLSGAVPVATTATLDCGSVLSCPATLSFAPNQSTATFAVAARTPVSSSTALPIKVTLNGVTQQAMLTLVPLAVQTLTMSPTSVKVGGSTSLTVQLNAPVPVGQTLTVGFAGNSASVAKPSDVTFGAGDVVKLVTIVTGGALTQTTTVTMTATLTQAAMPAPNTSTKTVTFTVTP